MQYTYKDLCNIYKKNICNFVTSITERGRDEAVKEQEKTNIYDSTSMKYLD